MAEKFRRIIKEKEIARHRRLRQQIGHIKELVFQFMEEEAPPCGLMLAAHAPIRMSMERKLNLVERQGSQIVKQPANALEKIEDLERFGRLLNATHIDKKKLWQKVEQALQAKTTTTLSEIIEIAGLYIGDCEDRRYYNFL